MRVAWLLLPLAVVAPARGGDALDAARKHLGRTVAVPGELAHAGTSEGEGGVRFVHFEQRFDEAVSGSRTTVAVGPRGEIVATRLGRLAAAPPAPGSWPADPAPGAIRAAVASLDLRGADGSPLTTDAAHVTRLYRPARLGAEPVLRVRAWPACDPSAAEDLDLAASDLRLVDRRSAHFDAVSAVRAWPLDPQRPSVLVPLPDPASPASVHSPLGWAGDLETSGNNVRVVLDRPGTRAPGLPTAVAQGDPPVLDFPFTGSTPDDADAAMANVFWALNDAHDRFRALGFDEPSGAPQADNFGRGGVAGDRLTAYVQSGSIDGLTRTNLIRLTIGPDGGESFMTVGIFEVAATNELRDGAFETDLLQHEYAHAVLARILGDAACFNGHHPRGLSEGWADFFAASFSGDPVIGAWTRDDPARGQRSASLEDNFYSLSNFCLDGCNPNRNGEIWAGLLWDVRRLLVARLGPEEGVEAAERLALDAVRYLPCTPTFLDAREALLLAEDAMFGGSLHCALWDLLVFRGMGHDATTRGIDDPLPQAGYAMPPWCGGGAEMRLDAADYGLDADVAITVLDGAPPAAASVRVESASGDAEVLPLAGSPPRLRAVARIAPGPVVAGDGVLSVIDGDVLTASYAPHSLSAQATVTADAAAFPVLHLVLGSACRADDDHLAAPGFFFLPGFLDAGEAADVVIAMYTTSPGPLVDATVRVRSLNPRVSVAPSGPIPLGTVKAAPAGGTTLIVFTISAAAAPDVAPGESADLELEVAARGRTSRSTMRMTLHQDYVLVTGLSPFAGGVETFEADSPSVASWTHAARIAGPDSWSLDACAGDGSARAAANASPGCASYPDEQGAPLLLSPPLVPPLPSDAVGFRITELSWRHALDLYEDPTRPGCERDVVAAFLTTDPATIPVDPAPVRAGTSGALRVTTSDDDTAAFVTTGPATAQTGAVYLQQGQPTGGQRLAWAFYSDVRDAGAPACVERPNTGTFVVDDVRFAYEYVRQVPESDACGGECKVLARAVAVPAGPACPGDAFVIDASGSSIAGCLEPPTFSFRGPGVPPEFALTASATAPAIHESGGRWEVEVTCENGPSCSATVAVAPQDALSTGRGGEFPGTVRVARRGDDVEIGWLAAADPPRHGAWRASSRAELQAPLPSWMLVASADAEGLEGEVVVRVPNAAREPGLAFYRVATRNPCTNEPR